VKRRQGRALMFMARHLQSATMSNWTREEVEVLKSKNGGGNDHARRTWMAKLPLVSFLLLKPTPPR
jgi:hypothetical protein